MLLVISVLTMKYYARVFHGFFRVKTHRQGWPLKLWLSKATRSPWAKQDLKAIDVL